MPATPAQSFTFTAGEEPVLVALALSIYKKLLAYQKSRGYGAPDDYVFFP